MTHYLEGEPFRHRHPRSFELWARADEALWRSDSQQQLTTVGHLIRETMQGFATELVDASGVDADSDHSHDVARVRVVLTEARGRLGKTHFAVLDALLVYWGTVSDLAQRQEHGAQRESAELTWEDARRLVFLTAMVMYEVDRGLGPLPLRSA